MFYPFSLPKLYIGIIWFDNNGDLIDKRVEEGHSWTRNAWNFQFGSMAGNGGDASGSFGAGYMSAKNIDGTVYSNADYVARPTSVDVASYYNGWDNSSTENNNEFGVYIGSSDAAFSIDDYQMASQIISGTSAGQLEYQAQEAPVLSYDPSTAIYTSTHSRLFINFSGGTVTVREIGLVWRGNFYTNSTESFLMARDVLGAPAEVADGNNLQIEYYVSVDFSEID